MTVYGDVYGTPAYAAAADVRYGVDRGDGQASTCRVAAASDVRAGVNVDVNGVGTLAATGGGLTDEQDATLTTILAEVQKVPRAGTSHRYSRPGVESVNVAIAEVPSGGPQ